jgi:hypothetical protein
LRWFKACSIRRLKSAAPQPPGDAPIFVIGTGRSGRTLLRQMLNAHPRIYITHEAFFYSYASQAKPGTSATEWLER